MKRVCSVVCLGVFAGLALALALQLGGQPAKSDEVPITTKSAEALRLFIEGRDLYEFYHTDKAHALFKRAIELDPDFAQAHLLYGATAPGTADWQAGLTKAFALAAKASPAEQKMLLGNQAALVERDAVKANKLFQEVAGLFPKDKRVHWYLAATYGNMNEFDKEIAELNAAIALDKDFAPPYETLGYVYRWRNQYDKAEGAFNEYGRLSPREANSHDILGDLYVKMGRFEDAVREYEAAVRMDPTFILSQQKIGSALIFQGRYEEARQAFLKAMDLPVDEANKIADQNGIKRTFIYAGDYAKALEAADKADALAAKFGVPEEISFDHIVRGFIHCQLGDYDKADGCVNDGVKALEAADLLQSLKDNQMIQATFVRIAAAAGRKDFDKAQALVESFKTQVSAVNNPAVQKWPSWAGGYVALAQGDAAKAVQYLSQGEMDDPVFMYYLAAAKEKAGDKAGAAELYKKLANWNEDSVWYAFVRSKAIAKL